MNSQEENPPGVEPLKKLIGKLQENTQSLKISRIPIKTKRSFIELSNNDFCGDYGMCLKFLIDGILTQETGLMIEKINELDDRIKELENRKEKPIEEKESTIKLLNGKVIKMNR